MIVISPRMRKWLAKLKLWERRLVGRLGFAPGGRTLFDSHNNFPLVVWAANFGSDRFDGIADKLVNVGWSLSLITHVLRPAENAYARPMRFARGGRLLRLAE